MHCTNSAVEDLLVVLGYTDDAALERANVLLNEIGYPATDMRDLLRDAFAGALAVLEGCLWMQLGGQIL